MFRDSGDGHCMGEWSEAKRRQQDVDARWTKQRGQQRGYRVAAADVHESRVFEELPGGNTSRAVWADSAYRWAKRPDWLKHAGYREHIQRRGAKAAVPVQMGAAGEQRAGAKIGLRHLACNMDRLGFLAGVCRAALRPEFGTKGKVSRLGAKSPGKHTAGLPAGSLNGNPAHAAR